jgi:hypothetical protein
MVGTLLPLDWANKIRLSDENISTIIPSTGKYLETKQIPKLPS